MIESKMKYGMINNAATGPSLRFTAASQKK